VQFGCRHLARPVAVRGLCDLQSEAIRIDPNDARNYYTRGVVCRAQGDKAKAEADFAKAKELGFGP